MASDNQKRLTELYGRMAREGYATVDGQQVVNAFNDMEIHAFRELVKPIFVTAEAKTLLDYGCGGSDYEAPGFDGDLSARQYFGLDEVFRYEPARGLDQRRKADVVVCFDVLEHIFIADVAEVVRELFSLAGRLVVANVACYSARAMLPNGENAHVTVRDPMWWKGMFDAISPDFPEVCVLLMCSTGWRQVQLFDIWSASTWLASPTFVTKL